MRRKRNVLDDSDTGSQSADTDDTVNNSRPATKKKATARKRGRPPATTKKKTQQQQVDSDDGGSSTRPNTPQNGNQSSDDEDNSGSNSAATKKKVTARKRGRPPGTTKNNTQQQQDDSDDGGSSTRPNTPQNSNQPSEDEDNSGDSDYVADSTSRPKRRPGRTPASNKRQRLQNGTSRDTSPQPSTSQQLQNGTSQNAQEIESDSDSGDSESADSDFGLFNERSLKKKPAKKLPQRTAKNKPSNFAGSNSNRPPVNSSQLNMSASLKKGSKLNQTPAYDPSRDLKLVESLAQKLVYFLLIEDQKKYAIRRKGIVTHVFKDDYSPKLYAAVIKKANVVLKKIYGMELMEIENQKDSYLIANILKPELGIHEFVDLPRMKQQQHGLISFLLTVIFMNENVITEDELTRCLKPLGIDLTSKRLHPVFGDVKKYITTELVKQMYLNYECISKEPPRYEFTWGLRAKQEFDKRDLLQFVCMIMDDTSPEDWRIQFRDAETSAKSNTDSSSSRLS